MMNKLQLFKFKDWAGSYREVEPIKSKQQEKRL